jgi:hypothetical protein
MASATEFPFLIKKVLLTPTVNSASIYGFKFWVRGKPWVVAVDDNLYGYNKMGIS